MNHKDTKDTETLQDRLDDFVYDVRNDLRRLRRNIRYYLRVFHNRLFDKTYRTTLKEILETGEFGGLKAGATVDHLICSMGEPDGGRGKPTGYGSRLWSYAHTEVGIFEDSQTVSYFKLPLQYEPFWLPVNVVIDDYFPNSETTLEKFEAYLQDKEIEYIVLWDLWDVVDDIRLPNVFTASGRVSTTFGKDVGVDMVEIKDTLGIIGIYGHDDFSDFEIRRSNHIALTIFDILNDYVGQSQNGKVFYGYSARLGITEDVRLSVSYKAGRRPTQRYELSVPDLGVVVVKPNTNMQELLSIIRRFFYSQTKEFWIVFPTLQQIHQYKGSEPNTARIYRGSEKIDAEDLFPGIEGLTTDAIFNLPKWAIPATEHEAKS